MKLRDIARLAEVSVTTASYVINGQAERRRISASTVARVMEVVQRHGYLPDPQAAALRRGHSRTLAFVIPDLENPSYARIAKRLERGARDLGYQLLVASSDDDPDSERQLVELFRARRCDALLVASCLPPEDPLYPELSAAGLPVIAVDRALAPSRIRSVISDDQQAGFELTRTLLQPQPRHIALLGARPELRVSRDRELGFRAALRDQDVRISVLHATQFERSHGRELMDRLLAEEDRPDALLTTAYVLLEGVLESLQQHDWPGYLAPRMATFGDTRLLDFLPMRIDGIEQQHALIAERLLYWALRAIEHGDYQPGVEAIPRRLNRRRNPPPAA